MIGARPRIALRRQLWANEWKVGASYRAYKLGTADPALTGTYTFRLRATTDTRGTASSAPVTFTLSPAPQN